jgi:hypothetical protein
MEPDPAQPLKETHQYLSNWLKNAKEVTDLVPAVQQSLVLTEFRIGVIDTAPRDLPAYVKVDLLTGASGSLNFWKEALPKIAQPSRHVSATTGFAMDIASSNVAFQSLVGVTIGHSKAVTDWAVDQTSKYQAIAEHQHRTEAISKQLAQIFPHRSDELKNAIAAFQTCTAGYPSRRHSEFR